MALCLADTFLFCFVVLEDRVSAPGSHCMCKLSSDLWQSCLGILSACLLGVSSYDSWWVFLHIYNSHFNIHI